MGPVTSLPSDDAQVVATFLALAQEQCDGTVEILFAMGFDRHGYARASVACRGEAESNRHGTSCLRRIIGDAAVDRVALVHNHPDGHPHPTTADRDLTRRLGALCRLSGVRLLDHWIFGGDGPQAIVGSRPQILAPTALLPEAH